MTHQQTELLLATIKKEDAHYLPMEKTEFLEMFGIAVEAGEISGMLTMKGSDGKDYIVAYGMNNCLYQSSNPKYKPSELLSQ